MNPPPALVVGLGNPGEKYARTRHNVGFWFVERLAQQHGALFSTKRNFYGDLAEIPGCRLLRPATFMNHSGRAVAAVARYYKILPPAIVIAHDEVDLPAGVVRLKFGGGDAGHNGLADITSALGVRDYWRLRLGVGKPAADLKTDTADYVLRIPAQAEMEMINHAIVRSMAAWPASGDYQKAMLQLHTKET